MKEKVLQAIRRALEGTEGFKLKVTFHAIGAIFEIKSGWAIQAILLDRILAEDQEHKRRGTTPPSLVQFTKEECARLAEFLYEENKEEFIKFLHDAIENIEVVE